MRAVRQGLLALLYLPVLVSGSLLQGQTPALTTDWIAGAGRKVDDVPSFTWLENGSAILDDVRLPASEQTFEGLDPVTGKRRPLLDMKQAVSSLKSIAPDVDVQGALPWPVTYWRQIVLQF